jgi:hypothetical protein
VSDDFEGLYDEVPVDTSDSAMLATNGGHEPGYVTRLNRRHAVVRLGAKTVILDEQPGEPAVFMPASDMHLWYANDRITIGNETVPISVAWLQSPRRRQYERVVFDPRDTNEAHYNFWQDFAVQPDASRSCEKFLAHIRDNVCSGNVAYYNYVIGWLAHMVQRPWEKPGVAIALRGDEGVGKGFFANVVGRLCPHHFLAISQAAHLTGRFNAHLQQCLLAFIDEAFWAGDKSGAGALKHLVTDEILTIEPKHVNPFSVRNLSRLIIASNEKWVVPAGLKARRWFIIDVSAKRANDRAYFTEISAELNNGGLQAFMHLLQTFDLSTVDVFTAPKTEALLDQKEESMPPHEQWWFQCLQEGVLVGSGSRKRSCGSHISASSWSTTSAPASGLRRRCTSGCGRAACCREAKWFAPTAASASLPCPISKSAGRHMPDTWASQSNGTERT